MQVWLCYLSCPRPFTSSPASDGQVVAGVILEATPPESSIALTSMRVRIRCCTVSVQSMRDRFRIGFGYQVAPESPEMAAPGNVVGHAPGRVTNRHPFRTGARM